MKTACVYHAIDLDGWMSAAIVKYWFKINHDYVIIVNKDSITNNDKYSGEAEDSVHEDNILEFIGYNHGQQIPDLSEYNKVIMCDISFPPDYMKHLIDKLGINFIWIDHHISAIETCPLTLSYSNSGTPTSVFGIRSVNYSACELTWKYLFTKDPMPEIVRLLGRYDCFGSKGTDEEIKVLEFQYGARECISNYEEAYNYLLDEGMDYKNSEANTINIILAKGKSIYQYLCTEAKQSYKNGFTIILKEPDSLYKNPTDKQYLNRSFIVINKERFNPINFGIDYHKDGYDGVASFYLDKDKNWSFSLYNDNGHVDCSAIAQQFGGGGHKGAAGFRIDYYKLNSII